MLRSRLLCGQGGRACEADGSGETEAGTDHHRLRQTRRTQPGSTRNQYVEIRQEKPKNKYQQDAPEYSEIRKVCDNPDCPVHHPKKQQRRVQPDAATKAAQEKQRREEAVANTTGIRVLAAIADAVPVRLMKRDLLFVVERLAGLVDERRLEIVARQRGIKREKDNDSIPKLFASDASLRIRSEPCALPAIEVIPHRYNCYTIRRSSSSDSCPAAKVEVTRFSFVVTAEVTGSCAESLNSVPVRNTAAEVSS
jgi:ParB family transcriptional regulator, chromosome partitioning protein